MKTPGQFIPLLTLMTGIRRYGIIPLLIWIAITTTIAHMMTLYNAEVFAMTEPNETRQNIWAVQIAYGGALYGILMVVASPMALEFFAGMPAAAALEFLFTRAVDRVIFLRAERVAFFIILIVPLLLNLALSTLAGGPNAGTIPPYEPERYAGWLVWLALLVMYLSFGYFLLVIKWLQGLVYRYWETRRGRWLIACVAWAPILSLSTAMIVLGCLRINIFLESFIVFARHPALCTAGVLALICLVQLMSERNLRKLDFP
jgi:hypothetical protein